MPVNSELVSEVSPTTRILKDTVEYHWLVGCTPTAVAMVLGYWDRHGYPGLIKGDSSSYNTSVKYALASEEHYRDYFTSWGTGPNVPDASISGEAHEKNSIADFLYTSRSSLGLGDGWTFYSFEGVGVHGYASHRGYDGFEANFKSWGNFNFASVSAEIDAGRPVILSVDSSADGVNDHNIVVYGYNAATNQLLIHDGWERTSDLRWIDFKPATKGHEFGIVSATFVQPPVAAPIYTPQFLRLVDDGSGTAASYTDVINEFGQITPKLDRADSNLNRTATLGIATADGHTVFQLYNDGYGTAALYQGLSYGNGEFAWVKASDDSGLGSNTLELATVDGKTFYQLVNDGFGTAALYEAVLSTAGKFTTRLLSADCGLGLGTVGFSTSDGKSFFTLVNDGVGTAASYRATLRADGTFVTSLISSESGASRLTLGHAEWVTKKIDPSYLVNAIDGTAGRDFLVGTNENDVITGRAGEDYLYGGKGDDILDGGDDSDYNQVSFDGNAREYTFSRNPDGSVTVKHPVFGTDILKNIDGLWFDGEAKWYALEDVLPPLPGKTVTGTSGQDFLWGTNGNDVLIGLAGDDYFYGGRGDDIFDGGPEGDYNQVNYEGSAKDYTFTRNADGSVTVKHPIFGTDTLKNIDGLWFDGEARWYALDDLLPKPSGRVFEGTAGADAIEGTSGDDVFNGRGGDDTFVGGRGNDRFNGGEGYDQVDFFGTREEYAIKKNADGTVTISHATWGSDTLDNIEGIYFYGDGKWIDPNSVA